jgi:hypothetical protein
LRNSDLCIVNTNHRPFLTGSASQTESSATRSKQSTGPFLTGARTAFKKTRELRLTYRATLTLAFTSHRMAANQ